MIALFFYLSSLILSLCILRVYIPLYVSRVSILLFSFFAHAVLTYVYSQGASDSSTEYFPNATANFSGFGTAFIYNLVWFVRHYFTGNSMIETFYFFSAFSFLGGVLWYVLYLQASRILNLRNDFYIFPAAILMCWPSALIFTNAMGKDSLCYFFIPLSFIAFFNLIQKKNVLLSFFLLAFSITILSMIRPYLLMIYISAYYISMYPGLRKLSIQYFLISPFVFCLLYYIFFNVLTTQGGLDHVDIDSIYQKTIRSHEYLSTGTHFYIPNTNMFFSFLLLPYSFFMNLFSPLFFLAKNIIGIFASFENSLLLYIAINTFRQRNILKGFFSECNFLKLLFFFFVMGLFFLAMGNTNLGLAMREKLMYVPCFLVLCCLTFSKKRSLIKND